MKIHKRIIGIFLAVLMAVSMVGIPGFAITKEEFGALDPIYPEVRNVRFMNGGAEVFTLPSAGSQVSAEVVLSNPVSGVNQKSSVALILAAYDAEGIMTGFSIKKNVITERVLPTIASSSIKITENTASVHLMVWNYLSETDMKAVAPREYVLSDVSRNTRIESFTAGAYSGLINHDLKTIRFYVPTHYVQDYNEDDPTVNYSTEYGDALGPLYSYSGWEYTVDSAIAPPNYQPTGVSFHNAVIEVGEGASITEDTSGGVCSYIVTAPNGETAVYSLLVQTAAAQVISNFDQARLGTPASSNAISEAGLNDTWAYYSYANVAAHRPGMFANIGKQGGGYWKFDENSVVYATEDGLGFANNSPLTVSLPYKGDTTDRYAQISSNVASSDENYSFWYMGSGMKDRHEMFGSFDYMADAVDYEGSFRFVTPYCQVMLRNDDIRARVNGNDHYWLGDTISSDNGSGIVDDGSNGGYSTIRADNPVRSNGPGVWNNLQFVSRVLDDFAADDGQFAVITELYLNGEYAGYVYANDFAPLAEGVKWMGNASKLKSCFGFKTGYNTMSDLCLDNLVWGTPYN